MRMFDKPFRRKTALFAVLLVLSIVLPMTALTTASAHTPAWNIASFAYVTAAPNPVGVGQTVYVYMWVDTPLSGSAAANDIRRHDYTLTVTDPDGQVTTKKWDVVQDTTNVQAYSFTPTKVGNYTAKFNYAGQEHTWSGDFKGDKYLPAEASTIFRVQEEAIAPITSGAALPTEYWTRPINGENGNWYSITSNWLNGPYIRSGATATGGAGYGRYQKDGSGPETSHIMWTKPLQHGGVVGGTSTTNNGSGFYTGSSYNVRFSGSIIMQGVLYYQEPLGNAGTGGDYVAVNLQTGEELWRINTSATGVSLVPSFGYLYCYESPNGNQHGVLPNGILVASTTVTGYGTVWKAYDAVTGDLTAMNITNIPSGTAAAGPRGEYLIYQLVNYGTAAKPNWYLLQWNSSKILIPASEGGGQPVKANTVWYTGTANASLPSCYDWNVSLSSLTGTGWSINRDVTVGSKIVLTQGSMGTGPRAVETGMNMTVVSIDPASFGTVSMTKAYQPTGKSVTRTIIAVDTSTGVFVTEDKETLELNGFSLSNGNLLWTTEPLVCEWDTLRRVNLWAYGNIYCSGYDGIVYCYDMATGKLEWTYGNGGVPGNSTNSGSDTVYGHYPTFVNVIADGKVYTGTTEHSPDQPLYKGSPYRCLNATTGEEIWTLTGMGSGMYIGQIDMVTDGYFTYLNIYDMQIYTVGKGASKLTVEAPSAGVTQGQSVVIKGTVTDIAAGATQTEQAGRFPNGVPCVSDNSMREWMEYVYMQQNKPTTTTGVEVTISVVDANGNYRVIGSTTTVDGFFTFNWTPDITGQYLVYASFAGSKAYYQSSAMTSFAVDPAQTAATPAPTQAPSMADQYFLPAIAGLFVAVIVVGLLIILVLRKHP